jgi:hypothetical protein
VFSQVRHHLKVSTWVFGPHGIQLTKTWLVVVDDVKSMEDHFTQNLWTWLYFSLTITLGGY